MTSIAAVQPEPAPLAACTVCRDVQNFDLLIEDMEAELGEGWGDLSFDDARHFLTQPDAETLEFIAVAMDEDDENSVAVIADLIRTATARDIQVIVIAEEVSPMVLHQLLKLGAQEFVPYPLPEGALHEAIERLRDRAAQAAAPPPEAAAPALRATGDRDGVILPVHGLAGGVGSTTFAVNLAWELSGLAEGAGKGRGKARSQDKVEPPRVCLLDLDLQYGAVATYLDLPRRDSVYELLADTESMDQDSFMQALLTFNDRLHVFTAPAEMLPLDLLTPEDMGRLLEIARNNFDYVVIDMPSTVVQWTETVLSAAHVYFGMLELDMRSAQNALRLIRALKAEDLPVDKMRYVLNRGPKFTDMAGRSRAKRMADSLDIRIEVQLPDGGRQVPQACDHGQPLAETAKKNPLRKEIAKIAASAHDLNRAAATAD